MIVKQPTIDMLDELIFISKLIWGKDAATKYSMRKRIELFPEGFGVVFVDNKIAGFSSSARLSLTHQVDEYYSSFEPWEKVHNPDGQILYFYNTQVHPSFRNRGIWRT